MAEPMKCKECSSTDLFVRSGETVCRSCGLIASDSEPAETAVSGAIKQEDVPDRLVTKPRTPAQVIQFCERMGSTQVKDTAVRVWEVAKEMGLIRLRKEPNSRGFSASVLFHAFKLRGVPRTPKEIAMNLEIPLSAVRRMIKHVQPAADSIRGERCYSSGTTPPDRVIARFCERMQLDKELTRSAISLARTFWREKRARIRSFETDSTASAIIAIAMSKYTTMEEATDMTSRSFGVCVNTTRSIFRELECRTEFPDFFRRPEKPDAVSVL